MRKKLSGMDHNYIFIRDFKKNYIYGICLNCFADCIWMDYELKNG